MPNYNEQHKDYWNAVETLAQNVFDEFKSDDEECDDNEHMLQLINEAVDQHEYVIHEELQIQTLQQSQHPCAALYEGLSHDYRPGDNFPFAAFAASAMEADVTKRFLILKEKEDQA